MSGNIWLEIERIISGLATPIVVAILGVMLLRRIESVKAGITRQSTFHVRWADEFFEACQTFLQCLERETAILLYLHAKDEKNDDDGLRMQHEQGIVHLQAYEMQFRIKRLSGFAPKTGDDTIKISEKVFNIVNGIIRDRQGALDPVFKAMGEFNNCARRTHAEMLALDRAKA